MSESLEVITSVPATLTLICGVPESQMILASAEVASV